MAHHHWLCLVLALFPQDGAPLSPPGMGTERVDYLISDSDGAPLSPPGMGTERVDYLISDSDGLKERPSVLEALSTRRDAASWAMVLYGCGVSACNVAGLYGEGYPGIIETGAALGALNGALGCFEAADLRETCSDRPGIVNDAAVTSYAAAYTLAASWLAVRALGTTFPLEGPCAVVAAGIFAYALLAPITTLIRHTDVLSPTELLRARGLLAIGLVAVLFVPDCLCFALQGDDWWTRVVERHPKQPLLESSTALFGAFAVEASMLAHRAGKLGVRPFREIVPAFVTVVFVLAVLPTAANLYWNGLAISFLDFYTD